jgi:hypothetical protein
MLFGDTLSIYLTGFFVVFFLCGSWVFFVVVVFRRDNHIAAFPSIFYLFFDTSEEIMFLLNIPLEQIQCNLMLAIKIIPRIKSSR